MSQIKNITTRSGILFFGKIIDAFFMFVFNFLAAKYIGAEGYGTYVYISTLIMFLSIGIKLGMDHGLTALMPTLKDVRKEKELVSFTVLFLFLLSLLLVAVFTLGADFVAKVLLNNIELKSALKIFLPLMFPIAFVQMSEGIFRTVGGIKHYFLSKNIIMPLVLVCSFLTGVFVLNEATLETLVFSNYIAWLVNVVYLLGVLIYRRILCFISFENYAIFKQLLIVSLPLILVGLIEFLMGRIDAYIIGYQLSEVDVGVYSIVDKLAYIGNFMFITAGSMMAPVLARHYAEGSFGELRRTYLEVNRWILIVNTAVFGGLFLLGNEVLGVFGDEFLLGTGVLYALAFAQLVNAFFGPLTFLNAMVGLERVEWRIGLFMLISNSILDLMVIHKFGITGVAIVSVVIYLTGNIIRMWWFKRSFGVDLIAYSGFKIIGIGVLAYLPMSLLLALRPFSSFILTFLAFGAGFTFIYLILIWTFALKSNEKLAIKQLVFKNN